MLTGIRLVTIQPKPDVIQMHITEVGCYSTVQTRRTLFAIALAVRSQGRDRADRRDEAEMLLPPIVLESRMLERGLERTRIPRHEIKSLFHTPSQPRHFLDVRAEVDTVTGAKPCINAGINGI